MTSNNEVIIADSDQLETDEHWMRHAIAMAQCAEKAGEVPVGANNPIRIQCKGFIDGNRIVSKYLLFYTKLAKILHQIVGKRIVVIDDQNHFVSRKGAKPPSLKAVNDPGYTIFY